MLCGLELGLQNCFERHRAYAMFQELKLVFQTHAVSRGMRPLTSTLPTRWRRIAQPVSMCSDCLGTTNCLNQVGVNLPDKIVIDKSSLVTITKLLELGDGD